MSNIELGDKARDNITGFSGTVTAICRYLGGQNDALIEAPSHDEKEIKSKWICLSRLSRIE